MNIVMLVSAVEITAMNFLWSHFCEIEFSRRSKLYDDITQYSWVHPVS